MLLSIAACSLAGCDEKNDFGLISSKIQDVLEHQIVFGEEYDIGIISKAKKFNIQGADGIFKITDNGKLQVCGFGYGDVSLKFGKKQVVYEGVYSVYQSILCTEIKSQLLDKGIIKRFSENVQESKLGNITEIDLSRDLKNDPSASKGVKYLKNLKKLDLSYNNLDNLDFISSLENIEELNLSNNNIENIDAVIDNKKTAILDKIKTIDLSNNLISNITKFQNLHGIVNLNLSNNYITDISPISSAYDLESLNLSDKLFLSSSVDEASSADLSSSFFASDSSLFS